MSPEDVLDLLRLAMWTVAVASSPALVAAMLTGILIAVLQAVTQIQEVTLTFVPKVVAVILALLASTTVIGSSMQFLAEQSYAHIATPSK